MKLTPRQQMINYYADHPKEFIEDMLGAVPSPQQSSVLNVIPQAIKEKKGITVKSGHGCFGKGTKILMYDGTIKNVEDITVGEQIMGDDSTPRNVLQLKRGQEELFRFEYTDGNYHIFNKSHILCLRSRWEYFHITVRVSKWLDWSNTKKNNFFAYKVYPGGQKFEHLLISNVKSLDVGDYYGFVLDGNHKFLDKNFFVLHNTGKTCMQAWIINWFLCTRAYPRVIATAPTQRQLFDVLWAELSMWHKKNKFGNMFEFTSTALKHKNYPKEWFAVARTSNKPENMQGFHAQALMFLVDECCHDDKTRVMTDSGWKFFHDLDYDDQVLTMNPITKQTEFQKPIRYHKYKHDGEMYSYDQRGGNFCVTPNHKFWYKLDLRTNQYHWDQIKYIKNCRFFIEKSVKWGGVDEEFFILNKIDAIKGKHIGKGKATKEFNKLKIDMKLWVEFLGWYLSEGNICYVNGRPYSVHIAQKIIKNRLEIIKLIKSMGFNPREYNNGISIHSKQLAMECKKYGRTFKDKYIPLYLKKLSKKYLKIFLKSFCKGDGYKSAHNRDIYYTSSKYLALDLHEIILKAGYASVIKKRKIKGDTKWIKDHYATSSCDGYVISKSERVSQIKVRQRNIKKVHYKGYTYCVTVPKYHLILTMRNGYPMWSGNSGVADDVLEVIEGTQSQEGSLVMMFGNPTQISGGFFDSFHDKRPFYFPFTFSAKEAENYYLPNGMRLVDPMNNEKIAMKYGEDSNVYRVRVLGEFPKSDPDTLIPLDLVEKAVASEVGRPPSYEVIEYGVDVARFGGDETAIYRRVGNVIEEVIIDNKKAFWRKNDTMFIVGILTRLIKEQSEFKFVRINVDDTGVGAAVTDRMKEVIHKQGLRAEVIPVNNGSKAPNDDKYANLATEMWFKMKDWLKEAKIPNCNDLIAQLSTRKFKQLSNGKLMLERKDEMKNRGLTSPDRADAAILTLRSLVAKYINVNRSNMFRVG